MPVIAVTFDPGDAGSISDGVSFGAADGMNVTVTGSTDAILETDVLFPSSDSIQFKSEAGNITFSSSGSAWATVATNNITGTYTNLTGINAQNDITANPEDKRSITIGGNIQTVAWRDGQAADDGTIDFTYSGPSGTSKITISGYQANTQLFAVDANTGTVLDSATSNGSGVVTFDSLDNSYHAVTVQTSGPSDAPNLDDDSMSPTGTIRTDSPTLSIDVSDPQFPNDNVTVEFFVDGNSVANKSTTSNATVSATASGLAEGSHDWYAVAKDKYGNTDTSTTKSFTVDHYDPVITDIKPSGDLTSEPTQISAQINDTDFATGNDGDSITVTINLDGQQVSQQTIGSNQTVSVSVPSRGQTGGSHSIEVNATDSYSQTNIDSSTYAVPANLTIRNELNYSKLIPANGEVRFFGEDQIYSRTAPNGVVNLDNLPVSQDFIVEVDPTNSNFTDRTVYIEGIYEQSNIYVLNASNVSTIQSRFILNDPTGNYGSESLLKIQRPINTSNITEWQTITSDEFGAEGITATLEEGTRYRLIVVSDTTTQVVGPYRADASETVTVEPGTPTIDLSFENNEWAADATLDNRTLEYRYADPTQETSTLTVWIHEKGNSSNKLQGNQTFLDVGDVSSIITLTANESEKEWRVNFVFERNGKETSKAVLVSNRRNLLPPLAEGWQSIVGMGMLILLAGTFSVLNATVGAVIVSLAGGVLFFLGFLSGATSGIAIVLALMLSAIVHFATKSR